MDRDTARLIGAEAVTSITARDSRATDSLSRCTMGCLCAKNTKLRAAGIVNGSSRKLRRVGCARWKRQHRKRAVWSLLRARTEKMAKKILKRSDMKKWTTLEMEFCHFLIELSI